MSDRPATRLSCVASALTLISGDVRAQGYVLGYCLAHPDGVLGHWQSGLEAKSEIEWITEETDVSTFVPPA